MRSAAKPAPIPDFLVGVLTETKIRLYHQLRHPESLEANSLGLGDGLVDVSAEEEVLSPGTLDDLLEPWLVDGEVVRVPSVNSSLVQIDNGDLDVGTGRISCVHLRGQMEAAHHLWALEGREDQLMVTIEGREGPSRFRYSHARIVSFSITCTTVLRWSLHGTSGSTNVSSTD